jgi:isopenicillin-N epimerase
VLREFTLRFGRALRPLWLLDEGMVYLNHGSFGATPEKVLTAQSEWRQRLERAPVRFMERTFTPALREAAAALGCFLGARGEDLVFVENATAGVNAVLRSLQFVAGDEIVTTGHCYNAVRQALAFVAATSGVRVIEVDVPFPMHSAAEVVEAVAGALSERTKLAVFDHVTSPTALVLPVADLSALCRARGIPVLIDGAHAPGMIPLALGALAAD